MTPLERLRLEKAAADCGFEMNPVMLGNGIELRSARFPERVVVMPIEESVFSVSASAPMLLEAMSGTSSVAAHGYSALYSTLRQVAARARNLPNRVADAFRQKIATLPQSTEAERFVVQRVGQDLFRAALLDFWQEKCCATGLADTELLRASHIKPWAKCDSDNERLDVFNGLLLAPHLDALFDGGWISFGNEGELLVSQELSEESRHRLGVSSAWSVHNLEPNHLHYLAFHRVAVFRRRDSQHSLPSA